MHTPVRPSCPSADGAREGLPTGPSAERDLGELDSHECSRLLGSCEVGRVVYTDGALPAVTPVNYAFDTGRILLRTAQGSRLATKLPGSIVAFEVDMLDRRASSGWSVVATGQCRLVTDPECLEWVSRRRLVPWASGDQQVVLEIAAARLSGSRILAGSDSVDSSDDSAVSN